ncbi:hypothetical protein B9Z19DRAFT_1009780, partial [Tuber borchii]
FLFGGTVTLYVGPNHKKMEIHKKLLASISPELDKHVNNDMREGIEGKIYLPDEREEVLTLFTQWAYTGDYSHKSIALKSPPDPKDPWSSLHKHLELCVFADKFNVKILKQLAESRFHTEINPIEPKSERDATSLVMLIGYAYDNLPSSHPILKYLAKYASWKLGLLRTTRGFNELILAQPFFLKKLLMDLNGRTAKPRRSITDTNTTGHPARKDKNSTITTSSGGVGKSHTVSGAHHLSEKIQKRRISNKKS